MVVLGLIEPKLRRILEVLVRKKGEFFHLSKVSKEARVPIASTFRIVNRLLDEGLIEEMVVGKTKLFRVGEDKEVSGEVGLIEAKLRRILGVMVRDKEEFFHLSKVSKEARVPIASTFRIVNRLLKLGLIEEMVVGKTKLFRSSEKLVRVFRK